MLSNGSILKTKCLRWYKRASPSDPFYMTQINTSMKTIGLLLLQVLLISLAAAATIEWDDLLVRWDYTERDPLRLKSFFKTPRTRSNAISAGWVRVRGVNPNLVTSYSLKGDPRFIVFYDCHGIIAGFQIGILVSDVADIQDVTQMSVSNMYQIKTIHGVDVWTVTVYTQKPAIIATGGRSRTWDHLTGTDGVWIETTDGYLGIPRSAEDLDPVWTKESCTVSMGLNHYFYDLHSYSACPDVPPVFPFFNNGSMTGLGIRAFGKTTIKNRNWYDNVTTANVRLIVPDGPECLYDWSDEYGFISVHVFFTSDPWDLTC